MQSEPIPEGMLLPTEAISMKELAALFKKSVSTLQRAFNKAGIYDALGLRLTRDIIPDQQLIIFALYYTPSKYYASYLWLEKNGYIETLLKKYDLLDFRAKLKEKRSQVANKVPNRQKKKK